MPDLSDEERSCRQRAVGFTHSSIQLSGSALGPKVEALNARDVVGELSNDDYVAAVVA